MTIVAKNLSPTCENTTAVLERSIRSSISALNIFAMMHINNNLLLDC